LTAQPISAYEIEWLVHHQDTIYAANIQSAVAIAKQRVREQDKLLRVQLRPTEVIHDPARG
jgi:hypothetical protein